MRTLVFTLANLVVFSVGQRLLGYLSSSWYWGLYNRRFFATSFPTSLIRSPGGVDRDNLAICWLRRCRRMSSVADPI